MVVRIKSGEVACDRSDYWVEVNLDLTTMKMEMPTISRHASGMWVAVFFWGTIAHASLIRYPLCGACDGPHI